jgi:hypothetical protein
MYRVGRRSNAHSHGTYIRASYVDVWRMMRRMAQQYNVSVSMFVNFAIFVFMTGAEPDDHPLSGKLPFSKRFPTLRMRHPQKPRKP